MYRISSNMKKHNGNIYGIFSIPTLMKYNIANEALLRTLCYNKSLNVGYLSKINLETNVSIYHQISNIYQLLKLDLTTQQDILTQTIETINILSQNPKYTMINPSFSQILPRLKNNISHIILSNSYDYKISKNICASFETQGFECNMLLHDNQNEFTQITQKYQITQKDIIFKVCDNIQEIKQIQNTQIIPIGYAYDHINKDNLYKNGAYYVFGTYNMLPNIILTEKNNFYQSNV